MLVDRYREHICADSGVDGYIINTATYCRINATEADFDVQKLNVPRYFRHGCSRITWRVSKACLLNLFFSLDIDLHRCHWTALKHLNVRWLVTEQRRNDSLLGRPIIMSLELNIREMLPTRAARFAGTVDGERLVESVVQYGGGRVSRVMEEFFTLVVVRNRWWLSRRVLWHRRIFIIRVGTNLDKKVKGSTKKRTCWRWAENMEQILRECDENAGIRYNEEPGASVRPLELRISDSVYAIRAKLGRYSSERRRCLVNYVAQLEKWNCWKRHIVQNEHQHV